VRRKLIVVAVLTLTIVLPYASWRLYDIHTSGLVVARGSKLYIGERQFTFLGANSFELWQYSLKEITEILDIAHQHGLRVVRVFLGGTAFEKPLGTYNEWNLRKLDYILAYCRLKGMYVIVTLRDNNWIEDVYWNETDGTVNKTRMYTNPEMIEAYKRFISHVLGRTNVYNFKTYKNDPTILGWDICNEPDITVPSQTLEKWVREIADYIRSIDQRHLITVGVWSQSNTEPIQSIVDFISVHSYPDENGQISLTRPSLTRPIILEEYGADKNFTKEKQVEIYRTYLQIASATNMSGVMFWNLGLGHNPWDRWIDQDAYLFTLIKNDAGTWLTDTYVTSSIDYVFFSTGSSVQVLVEHSAYVTIGILASAAIIAGFLFLCKKLRKGPEIPEEFRLGEEKLGEA